MENGPFIDDFPVKTLIYKGFSMAMSNNQMVHMICIYIYNIYIYMLMKSHVSHKSSWLAMGHNWVADNGRVYHQT